MICARGEVIPGNLCRKPPCALHGWVPAELFQKLGCPPGAPGTCKLLRLGKLTRHHGGGWLTRRATAAFQNPQRQHYGLQEDPGGLLFSVCWFLFHALTFNPSLLPTYYFNP